ncbi:hypothetical protein HRbin30_03124 [bacterium HR30]|nr:hypothetical protein HRbin30_03124 [bacterium HR30]
MESVSRQPASAFREELLEELERRRVLYLTTVGRKSGVARKVKVWFVFLAPDIVAVQHVRPPLPQWYRNILKNSQVVVDFGGFTCEGTAEPVSDRGEIQAILQKIRRKYGLLAWLLQLWGTSEAVAVRIRLNRKAMVAPSDESRTGGG